MHRFPRRVLAVAVLLLAVAGVVAARQTGRHPISGRVYAGAMDVSGAAWLERDEREDEEAPQRAIKILGIEPGATVADIGAGSGYFTVRIAKLVGPTGRVYANDIQQGMLDILQGRVVRARLTNVVPVLGTQTDPKLPPESIDLAIMVDVYHELLEPQAMLRKLRDALKPTGRLVLLEYREEDPAVPIQRLHKMSVAGAKLEVEAEGFTLSKVNEDLPWQHVLTFTKR